MYYSFKIFLRFWLAFNPRLIPANQQAPTNFGRRFNYWTIGIIINGRLMSHNNGFYAKQLESVQMAARFEHWDKNISKLLDDKGSKNTKSFEGKSLAILQERNIQNPTKVEELAMFCEESTMKWEPNALCVFIALQIFWVNNKTIIEFSFCMIIEDLCRSRRVLSTSSFSR